MEKSPLVSVIIPCYNCEFFITEAILSVINQTYKNIECIVVNDGSTDLSKKKCETLIIGYPDFNLKVFSKENQGLVSARNTGGNLASGKYLLFLDSDDCIRNDFLAKTVPVLEEQNTIGFVYSDVQHIGTRNDIWSGGAFNPVELLLGNQLTCTSLVRKSLFKDIGGFKPIMDKGYEDWEFWISCIEQGFKGLHIAEPLFYYRKHQEESMLDKIDANVDAQLKSKIRALHPELFKELDKLINLQKQSVNLETI